MRVDLDDELRAKLFRTVMREWTQLQAANIGVSEAQFRDQIKSKYGFTYAYYGIQFTYEAVDEGKFAWFLLSSK